jgi:hypothetical protein
VSVVVTVLGAKGVAAGLRLIIGQDLQEDDVARMTIEMDENREHSVEEKTTGSERLAGGHWHTVESRSDQPSALSREDHAAFKRLCLI